MSYRKLAVGLCVAFVLLLSSLGLSFSTFFSSDSSGPSSHSDTQVQLTHSVVFFDEPLFVTAMKKVNAVDPSFSYHIRGGIVPHHTFASEILSDFFHRLSKQKPKTVILIGPNHYEKGDGKVLISQAQWQTVFGIVEPNSWYIDQLVDSGFIKVDEKVVPEDHAVAALMPYLEHYLPETTVVPLLVSGFMNESEVAQLADELAPLVDEDTVIIAAVDFSHYLMSAQAHQRDELTSKLMRDHEYSEILRLNNEYLDSPQAIVALLMVMKKLEADQTELLAHTNSGDMQNNATIQTTSYFSMGFY